MNGISLMASQCSGSTKPSHRAKGRNFQITLNEVEHWEKLKEYLEGRKLLNYAIACKERAPTTGHEHIHCYVQFSNSTQLALSKMEGAHIEVCRGSPQQNVAYVKKDGVIIWETGTLRMTGNPTIRDIMEMDRDEIYDLPWQIRNTALKIKDEQDNDIDIDDWKKEVEIYWIMGPSGVGKTERAKQIVRDNAEKYGRKINSVKYTNTFWQGVGNAKIAIYDDFRDSDMKPQEFINFIDYNYHTMNIKGGEKRNEYELIIITSVQDPHYIYMGMRDEEPRKQWLRRMTIVDLTPLPEDHIDTSEDFEFSLC